MATIEKRGDTAADGQLSKALKRVVGRDKEQQLSYHEVLSNSRVAAAALRDQFNNVKSSTGYLAQQTLRNEVLRDQRMLLYSTAAMSNGDSVPTDPDGSVEAGRTSTDTTRTRRPSLSSPACERTSPHHLGVYQVDLSVAALRTRAPDAGLQRSWAAPASPSAHMVQLEQAASLAALSSPIGVNFNLGHSPTSAFSPPSSPHSAAAAPLLYSRTVEQGNSSALKSRGMQRRSSSRPSSCSFSPASSSLVRLSSDQTPFPSASPTGAASGDSPTGRGVRPLPFKSSSASMNPPLSSAEQSKRHDLLLHQLLQWSREGSAGAPGAGPQPFASLKPAASPQRRATNPAQAAAPECADAAQRTPSSSAGQLSSKLLAAATLASPNGPKQRVPTRVPCGSMANSGP